MFTISCLLLANYESTVVSVRAFLKCDPVLVVLVGEQLE
jgi:hypothetical protein